MSVWMDDKKLVFVLPIADSSGCERTFRVIVTPPYEDGESPPELLVQEKGRDEIGDAKWEKATVNESGIAIALLLAIAVRNWSSPNFMSDTVRRYDVGPFSVTDVVKGGGG